MFKLIVREELDMASADRSTLFINATILDGSEHAVNLLLLLR